LISVVIFIGFALVYLVKSKALDRIALKTDIDSTVADKELSNISEGDKGITVSRLNPIGKVRVNNITMEAKTLGGFIDENTEITVLKVFPTQLIVITN
jgi:membrane-bound ClpP family serine protease